MTPVKKYDIEFKIADFLLVVGYFCMMLFFKCLGMMKPKCEGFKV